MEHLTAFLLTIFVGLFFIIGFFISKYVKNKERLSIVAVSMAFIVMIGMIFLDLLPEIFEKLDLLQYSKNGKIFFVLLFSFGGVLLLKLLDMFIPHHHHEHHDNEKNINEHQEHLFHIGFITSFSLIIHNIIEGISIYVIGTESLMTGFLVALAVGLHNLPLGIEVASGLENNKESKGIYRFLLLMLSLSSSFGALLLLILGRNMNIVILLGLMCISLGMILYIALFELLKEVFNYKNKKETLYGILIGGTVLLLMTLLG